ncbi:FAD-dependent monooxygenase [uncultured Pseudacidovorax sp.]|uniref:FAD-dependent monooxygenase n=1 Tax=uncultured Pseudacidovorax sp. TaxID=679313 RepID=UPI0025F438E4|nr:FAD-dependent monooxygenase [uncultured Pseudacidovorax sp.]
MSIDSGLRVAVIGAGIGGLTLAALLVARGIRVVVFEQARALGEVGAGLQVSPNGVKVLRTLGLAEDLARVGVRPLHLTLRDWKTGIAVSRTGIADDFDQAYGAPYYHVHRADLLGLLQRAAAGAEIRTGCAVTAVEPGEGGAWIETSAGREHFDVVVGADGIHSVVRRALHGPSQARFTGNVAFRALVPADDELRRRVARDSTLWMGPGGHVVHYFVRDAQLLNIVAVYETDRWTDESWTQPATVSELSACFTNWNRSLTDLLARATQCNRWALFDRDPLTGWGRGRVTLLGDAAHPMLPFLAQGAVMAIEDAYVLAQAMASQEVPLEDALRGYESSRGRRTARLQLAARAQGASMHRSGALDAWRRNIRLFIRSRWSRDDQLAKGQSLYGFDVTVPAERNRTQAR